MMVTDKRPDHIEAALNSMGSVLSILGTLFVLISYLILPHKKHIRHALIINLTVADFINSVNNSVSGLIVIATDHLLVDSPSCTANGFIGQLSVQAVDCSILAITLVTWWTVTTKKSTADLPMWKYFVFCAAPWVLPITTSFVSLGKGYYGPVSTSWCWITANPTYLRYVLTHGWRFIIIFIVSGLSIHIQIYLRRHMVGAASVGGSNSYTTSLSRGTVTRNGLLPLEEIAKKNFHGKVLEEDEEKIIGQGSSGEFDHDSTRDPAGWTGEGISQANLVESPTTHNPTVIRVQKKIKTPQKRAAEKRARLVQKTMLLNAYPIMYIILWIPGIANRIAEASGHPSYALRIMQAATQFIGLANAVTFGCNERIVQHLRARIGRGEDARRWTID